MEVDFSLASKNITRENIKQFLNTLTLILFFEICMNDTNF